jgi:hypothetical protein
VLRSLSWLNVRRQYLDRILQVERFFVNDKHLSQERELLLLQLVKQDEPGTILGRVRGVLIFKELVGDLTLESRRLCGVSWKYAIVPSRSVRLPSQAWFSLETVLGKEAAER